MNSAHTYLDYLISRGIYLRLEGDKLKAGPADLLDAATVEAIRERKQELLDVLKQSDHWPLAPDEIDPATITPCRTCGGEMFWRDIYGVDHCQQCQPNIPGYRMLRHAFRLKRQFAMNPSIRSMPI